MKMLVLAITTAAAALTASPVLAATANGGTSSIQLAQADVYVGPRGPGVVIDEPRRRPGITIETEGRRSGCRSVTVREWRNGERIVRTERRCD